MRSHEAKVALVGLRRWLAWLHVHLREHVVGIGLHLWLLHATHSSWHLHLGLLVHEVVRRTSSHVHSTHSHVVVHHLVLGWCSSSHGWRETRAIHHVHAAHVWLTMSHVGLEASSCTWVHATSTTHGSLGTLHVHVRSK